ncbi:MAG TPA: aminotransferase DegT, partial [Verrucomicrobiales bacterium]|nr:aminotransferase DegT [Verrucomicrobiales bacterium]
FANKHITTGEGGMIVTNDKNIYQKCLLLRNIYFNNVRRFKHYGLGWNYRLTNLQSALGIRIPESVSTESMPEAPGSDP